MQSYRHRPGRVVACNQNKVEFCTKNDEFCAENDELCVENDGMCIKQSHRAPRRRSARPRSVRPWTL